MALTTRDHAAPASSPLPEPPRVEVSGRASVGAVSTPSPASQGRHGAPSPAPRPFEAGMVSGVRVGVIGMCGGLFVGWQDSFGYDLYKFTAL